ncbi:MAG: hypothetical protein ABIH42_08305 [Planctomycetota bacterium]
MFFGKYIHTIDAKGRIIIPSELRDTAIENAEKHKKRPVFYIMPGPGGCLYLFEETKFDEIVNKQFDLGLVAPQNVTDLLRKFSSHAARRVCDAQGRIQVPEELITYSGLKKEIVFVGLVNRIEIWSSDSYHEKDSLSIVDFDKLAEELTKEKNKQEREGR